MNSDKGYKVDIDGTLTFLIFDLLDYFTSQDQLAQLVSSLASLDYFTSSALLSLGIWAYVVEGSAGSNSTTSHFWQGLKYTFSAPPQNKNV